MSDKHSLQEEFLSTLCREKVPVSVFLVNGIKLHGVIDSFDTDIIMLKNSLTQMIFKNAISTVVPARAVAISAGGSS